MAVSLTLMRDELLPGLRALQMSFAQTKEIYAAGVFEKAFAVEQAPAMTVSLPAALAAGVAAAVISNPVVSRRWWGRFANLMMDD